MKRSDTKNRRIEEVNKNFPSRENFQVYSGEETMEDKVAKINRMNRRRNISYAISAGVFVVFMMIITSTIILYIMKSGKAAPKFFFPQEGVIEHKVITKGILFREENFLSSPDNGYIKPLIHSGSRVSFGQTVAIVVRDEENEEYISLKNFERQISELQIELMEKGKGPGAQAIFQEAQEAISIQMDLARKDWIYKDLSGMSIYKTAIDVSLKQREERLLAIEFNDIRLNDLKKKAQNLSEKLEYKSGNIITGVPGIVSYVETLENKMPVDDIVDKFRFEDYKEIINSQIQSTPPAGSVEKGDFAARIVTGLYQYIVVVIPSSEDSAFVEDSYHSIEVPSKGIVIDNCSVVRRLISGNNSLVIFKTNRELSRLIDYKVLDLSINIKSQKGLKIPYSGIFDMDKDKTEGRIFWVVKGYVQNIAVKIIDYDRDYAIVEVNLEKSNIENMSENEKKQIAGLTGGYLIKNPESVEEGDNLGG